MDELDEMVDIIVVQKSWVAGTVPRPHNVAGGAPQMKNTKDCARTQHKR
jgi:hypothetical protein